MAFEPGGTEFAALVGRLRAAGCVFAQDEARLLCEGAADEAGLAELTRRRAAGEPLELVLGWAEFRGLRVAVEPGVFVPRRRTEFLAEQAAALLDPGDLVVDLCCGAGAIGAALFAAIGERAHEGLEPHAVDVEPHAAGIELHAVDIEPVAVRCARRNLAGQLARGAAFVYEGDLDAPLPRRLAGRVAVLTANVPYVPSREIAFLPSEAREHEPRSALDGGADGLDLLRRVTAAAKLWLRPGGSVLSEISERQRAAAEAAVLAAGLEPRILGSEEHETTVVLGRAPV
jgi:release factor glutamine methyltransferase